MTTYCSTYTIMKIYVLILAALRAFAQFVVDSYNVESQLCKDILMKAVQESIPSVKSAYFVTVMEEDQRAFFDTLQKYNLGFLAANTTYASEEEIQSQACKMPAIVTEALEWTAGLTPLVCVWMVYSFFAWLKQKFRKVHVEPPKVIEKVDKPPRVPRQPQKMEHMNYIRKPKPKPIPKESFAGKLIQNMSPTLRKRMMPDEV